MLTEEKLRQENRQSLNTKLRLESQNNPCQVKLDLLETPKNEHVNKICTDMQVCKNNLFCFKFYDKTREKKKCAHYYETIAIRILSCLNLEFIFRH
jgi:hypothetical protein